MRLPGLEVAITSLQGAWYAKSSDETDQYNCIAYAAEDTQHWWWPFSRQRGFAWWPLGVTRLCTVAAFTDAFRLLGYEPCPTSGLEPGLTKVAIYVDSLGKPAHMARQLPSGIWTSKCGRAEDIRHGTLHDVASCYGMP